MWLNVGRDLAAAFDRDFDATFRDLLVHLELSHSAIYLSVQRRVMQLGVALD